MGERVENLSPVEAAYRSVEAVKNLMRDIDMPVTLTELDIPKSAIPEMAAASINVTRLMANNPRKMTAKDSENVFAKAFSRGYKCGFSSPIPFAKWPGRRSKSRSRALSRSGR